ncbi:polysaccharide biosynthesis protein [Gracilinema caldarium]|uniref:polysaccharide biosynthesis protein n=1 Tax=Gracilinema caldarium TaxID=215591 RepID=UPI0026EA9165|nr:polysaccharide biosynthesis protein [Gracilinema caldarium]
MFKDKILLITGGTGSFGNAVLKRFLNTNIGEIRIFSRDEKKQDDMRHKYKNDKIKFYIGDVRDYDSIHAAMRGVDFVFSAAALKQVPSCEFYPLEAVKTNVVGTANTLEAAIACNVKKVIVLSTDKAVYPINAMGMSKALMEKVMIAKSRNLTKDQPLLAGTRYGNVMASRGSVIPLFIKQLKAGLPLTITNPNMTRFMMSLPQAVELVLFAFNNAEQGDIFVQKAPAATIHDLAEVLKEIFNGKSEIKIIGTRHGEKLYETLLAKEEAVKAIDMGNYYRVPADTRDLNYHLYIDRGDKKAEQVDEYNSHNTYRLTKDELKKMLLNLDYVKMALEDKEDEGV